MIKEKEDIWHIPVTWCIILVLIIIGGGCFAHQYCTNDDIVKLISFAATLASIILSILAIFMTILSNDSISGIVHKIMSLHSSIQTLPAEIKKSAKDMSSTITRIESATSAIQMASQNLKETSSQTTDVIENKIKEVQEQMHDMESHISQDIADRIKPFETREMPTSSDEKDDTEEQSHENLFIHNSLTNLVLLYAILLYNERNLTQPLNITSLCKEQKLGEDAYGYGALTAMAAMDLFQAKIYKDTDVFVHEIGQINPFITEGRIKEGIESWCKAYNLEDGEHQKYEPGNVIAAIKRSTLLISDNQ